MHNFYICSCFCITLITAVKEVVNRKLLARSASQLIIWLIAEWQQTLNFVAGCIACSEYLYVHSYIHKAMRKSSQRGNPLRFCLTSLRSSDAITSTKQNEELIFPSKLLHSCYTVALLFWCHELLNMFTITLYGGTQWCQWLVHLARTLFIVQTFVVSLCFLLSTYICILWIALHDSFSMRLSPLKTISLNLCWSDSTCLLVQVFECLSSALAMQALAACCGTCHMPPVYWISLREEYS